MNGMPCRFLVPVRGTISEVVIHSGCPVSIRVIKIDPPQLVEPGDTVMLLLTPAAVERTVIEETQPCPKCSKLMILVETGMAQLAHPARYVRNWRCGCGHAEGAPPRVARTPEGEWLERWQAVQR